MNLLMDVGDIKKIVSEWPNWGNRQTSPVPRLLMASHSTNLKTENSAGSIKIPLAPLKPILTGHTGATMVTYDTAAYLGQGDNCGSFNGSYGNVASWLSNIAGVMTGNG